MQPNTNQGPQSARYAYIDGLRGFAAAWVLLYHFWTFYYPGLMTQGRALSEGLPPDPYVALGFVAFGYGYTGVDLFFVLSGLCIHLPQARRGEYTLDIGAFASRRFWRLYPAYLASIVFTALVLLAPRLLLAAGGRTFDWWDVSRVRDALISAAFLQPFWPESLNFNGVYWTLVYEVQFYAAYPALLWSLRRIGFVPVGIALLASEAYLSFAPPAIPCLLPTRYFEWFLGVIAAEVIARRTRRVPPPLAGLFAAVGLGAGVYSTFHPELYPFRDLLLASGYFGLILYVAGGHGPLTTAFRCPRLVSLGDFSYSLYLIHVPIVTLICAAISRFIASRMGHPAATMGVSMLSIPVILAVSYQFYRWFERPFLRSRDRGPARLPAQLAEEMAAP